MPRSLRLRPSRSAVFAAATKHALECLNVVRWDGPNYIEHMHDPAYLSRLLAEFVWCDRFPGEGRRSRPSGRIRLAAIIATRRLILRKRVVLARFARILASRLAIA